MTTPSNTTRTSFADQLDAAADDGRELGARIDRLSVGLVAEVVREAHPTAHYVTLEPADEGPHWQGSEILAQDREVLADWQDIADGPRGDDLLALLNLNSHDHHPCIKVSADGRTEYLDLDEAIEYAHNH